MALRLDKKITAIHTDNNELIFINKGKEYYIQGEEKDSIILYFKGYKNADELLTTHEHLSQWFSSIEEFNDDSWRITSHPEVIILSRNDVCHECVLRWLPRSETLDEYIQKLSGYNGSVLQLGELSPDDFNWEREEIIDLLGEYPLCILDYDNRVKPFNFNPLPHPECLNSLHHFNDGNGEDTRISLLNLPFTDEEDLAIQINSEEKIANTYFHEVAIINSPSNIAPDVQLAGRGIAGSKPLAQKKAIVEAVERFHAWSPHNNLVYGSSTDFKEQIVNMDEAFLFGDEQYKDIPFIPYNPEQERWWVSGANITFPERNLIPLDFVQLESSSNTPNPLYHQSSTGMAGHTQREESVRAAMLEVIERAAQYNFWVENQYKKLRISNICNDINLTKILNDLEMKGVEVHFWSVPIDNENTLPETMVCCFKFNGKYVFSSACNLNPVEAIKRAFTEAYTEYLHAIELIDEGFQEPSSVTQPIDHLTYYLNPSSETNSVIDNYFVKETNHIPDNFEGYNIINALKNKNMDVILLDRNSMLSGELGVHIVHVFIPQLPSLGFKFEALRLPGVKYQSNKYSTLSKVPHPFG